VGWFQPGGEATLAMGPDDRVGVPVRHIRGDARHREYSDRRGDANKPVDSVSHGHIAAIGELRGSGKGRHRPASVACLVEWGSGMSCSSMINWEEFGRSQLARTVLNLSQLGRREASDLVFHRKAVARKMTGPHSHRGGHWFDPSIAHPAQRPVMIK